MLIYKEITMLQRNLPMPSYRFTFVPELLDITNKLFSALIRCNIVDIHIRRNHLGYRIILGKGFTSKKTEYEEGEHVEVVYPYVMSDVNYSFHADAEKVEVSYEGHTAVLQFVMPNHDVSVDCTKEFAMFCDPKLIPIGKTNPGTDNYLSRDLSPSSGVIKQDGEWVCELCNTVNNGKFCSECGNRRPER